MHLKTGKRPSTATCCHQSFISQCGHWNTSAYKWFMGTYCLPWTFFSLILDIISRTLYIMSYREANTSLTAALNTTVFFITEASGFSLLMDRWTDEWTDWVRQTDTQACQRRHVAGWRGGREGASAGGFEEQPWLLWIRISPDAGGGPRRAAAVPTGQGNHKWFKISSPKRVGKVWNKTSDLCLPRHLHFKLPSSENEILRSGDYSEKTVFFSF